MKKIIDSKGRLFSKINIIDFVIIVALIVLSLAAVIKFDQAESQMTTDKVIEYSMNIKKVRQATIDAINKNTEILFENDTKKELGTIVDIKSSPSVELTEMADGTYKNIELKGYYDVLLTVQVKGTETEDNFYTFTGKKIIVNDTITINNEYMTTNGIVKSVKILEQQSE